MILLIDVGNTRTKYLFVKHEVFSEIICVDNQELTADYMNKHWQDLGQCIFSNVSCGELTASINVFCRTKIISCRQVFTEHDKNGVIAAYDDVTLLGVDRWLALLAANYLYPKQNCIVVDTGTATTLDVITSQGKHIGGWILPGVSTMFDGLMLKTKRVHAEQSNISQLSFGKNTSDCVNQATWAATLALVNQAKDIVKQDNVVIEQVIITGGNGKALVELSSMKMSYIDDLVFYGLWQYAK